MDKKYINLTNKWVNKCLKKFGNKYDYSKFVYEIGTGKGLITCKDCGEFEDSIQHHYNKSYCPGCFDPRGKYKEGVRKRNIKKAYVYYEKFNKIESNSLIDISNFKLGEQSTLDEFYAVCKKHGKFKTTLQKLKNGNYHCIKCAAERKGYKNTIKLRRIKEAKEVFKQIKLKYPEYDFSKTNINTLKYKNEDIITAVCTKHGEFKRVSNRMLDYQKCPDCTKIETSEKIRNFLTIEESEYLHRLYSSSSSDNQEYNIIKTNKFVYNGNKVKCYCNIHKHEYVRVLNSLLGITKEGIKSTCPICSPPNVLAKSEAELKLLKFVKNNTEAKTLSGDYSVLEYNELDIYVPKLNFAIEYNGVYWHSMANKSDKNYHLNKTNKCLSKGIQLFHIFEDEYTHKKDIVESKILTVLGKSSKIYAGKCNIKEISTKESIEFLEKNHIKGSICSDIKIGLYYNDVLVSLININKTPIHNTYEILRYCDVLNTSIIGGVSKLLEYLDKNYVVNKIIVYVDKRWSNGNLYKNLGFDEVSHTKVDYTYLINGLRYDKSNFKKSILIEKFPDVDITLTEEEIMKSKNVYRIYDSGSIKLVKNKNPDIN